MGDIEPTTTPLNHDAIAYAVRWAEYRQRTLRIPGLVLAVRDGASLAIEEAFGHADVEGSVPMSPDHLFRVASHSKMYAATAVMQLVEAGRFRLDDLVVELLGFDADGPLSGVTVRHLLHHAAGLFRDGTDIRFWELDAPFPTGDQIDADASTAALVYPPTDRFKYSNVGYALIGRIIETVTGTPYVQHLQTAVLDPIGVVDTSPDLAPAIEGRMATGYTQGRYEMPRRPFPHAASDAYAPAAGVCATARDLLEFASAHFLGDERLVSDAAKREMHHGAWEIGGMEERYGLGFMAMTVAGREMVGHGGGYPGFITFTAFSPSDQFAVTALTNCVDGAAQSIVSGVVSILSAAPGPLADAPVVDPEIARRFTGRFFSHFGSVDIALIGDRLVGINPELPIPLEPVAMFDIIDEQTLRCVSHVGVGSEGEDASFTFGRDGNATSMIRHGTVALPPDEYRAKVEQM